MEALAGAPCTLLAYPYGLSDARVKTYARAAGFEAAFAFDLGPWERMNIPRLPAPCAADDAARRTLERHAQIRSGGGGDAENAGIQG